MVHLPIPIFPSPELGSSRRAAALCGRARSRDPIHRTNVKTHDVFRDVDPWWRSGSGTHGWQMNDLQTVSITVMICTYYCMLYIYIYIIVIYIYSSILYWKYYWWHTILTHSCTQTPRFAQAQNAVSTREFCATSNNGDRFYVQLCC